MGLISIPTAQTVIREATAPERRTLKIALLQLLAAAATNGELIADIYISGGGAGALYCLTLVTVPEGTPSATPLVQATTATGTICQAGTPRELQAQIALELVGLNAGGYQTIAKAEHAGAGAGALFTAALLASNAPPAPPPDSAFTLQTRWSEVPAQALPNSVGPAPNPVPGFAPIAFPVWAANDVLDGELTVAVARLLGETIVNTAFLPEVSIDGGATWHQLLGAGTTCGCGRDREDTAPGLADITSVGTTFAVQLPAGSNPMIRVSYAGSKCGIGTDTFPISGIVAASLLRCRRISANLYAPPAPYTLSP